MTMPKGIRRPKYFETAAEFSAWLEENHATTEELWVGYHKKASGRQSITYPESVDVALCFGWIDGVRYTVDGDRYTNRFSPRRSGSNWSLVNIRRAKALIKAGRMRPAGLKAFKSLQPTRSGVYSYENRPADLPARYMRQLKGNPKAWAFYRRQSPSYRRAATWWVMSARLEETRIRRLATLIKDSARGRTIGPLTRPGKSK